MALLVLVLATAVPNLRGMKQELDTTEDGRAFAYYFGQLRAEAIRTKSPVRLSFTSSGFSWDLFDDGSVDGSYSFHTEVTWESVPADIVMNGFGLIPAIAASETIAVSGTNTKVDLSINANGHVQIS